MVAAAATVPFHGRKYVTGSGTHWHKGRHLDWKASSPTGKGRAGAGGEQGPGATELPAPRPLPTEVTVLAVQTIPSEVSVPYGQKQPGGALCREAPSAMSGLFIGSPPVSLSLSLSLSLSRKDAPGQTVAVSSSVLNRSTPRGLLPDGGEPREVTRLLCLEHFLPETMFKGPACAEHGQAA